MYAVEASSMAVHCAKLVAANGLSDKIIVLAGKVEEVRLRHSLTLVTRDVSFSGSLSSSLDSGLVLLCALINLIILIDVWVPFTC